MQMISLEMSIEQISAQKLINAEFSKYLIPPELEVWKLHLYIYFLFFIKTGEVAQ